MKGIFAVVLSVVLVLSLTACARMHHGHGGGGQGGGQGGGGQGGGSQQSSKSGGK